jgi:hypothetical protein
LRRVRLVDRFTRNYTIRLRIVDRQPDVKAVRWVLDRDWYAARGITIR